MAYQNDEYDCVICGAPAMRCDDTVACPSAPDNLRIVSPTENGTVKELREAREKAAEKKP